MSHGRLKWNELYNILTPNVTYVNRISDKVKSVLDVKRETEHAGTSVSKETIRSDS